MIKFYNLFILSLGFCILSMPVSADILLGTATDTHKSTLELKPVSLTNSYKTAAVCFMGQNCYGDAHFNKGSEGSGGNSGDNFEIDTSKQCQNDGFTITRCPDGQAASGICPYDNRYFTKCVSYEQICKEQHYVTSCEEGKILDSSQTCSYESGYKKCICNPCDGYKYNIEDAIEDGYMIDGEPCNSCGDLKYKRKINECKGFVECDCGGEIGSAVCYSGSVKKFASCKACACPNGTIDSSNYWCNGDLKCWLGGK